MVASGSEHYAWKGDAASTKTKRCRAQRKYKLNKCERCNGKATDRHHKDGDTGNNDRSNLEFLCRRCHMEVDGRLEKLKTTGKQRGLKLAVAPKPCRICKKLAKPTRKGRCHRCDMYLRRTGAERFQEAMPV